MKSCRSLLLLMLTTLALSGCNDQFATKGYGDSKGYGDVQGYGTKQVGMCSYLGGCMPDSE